jgi:hypothetical protein
MTAEQRAELLKHVTKHDLSEKISYRDCEKIAKDLNLTLEQVGLFQAVGLILLFICFGIFNVSIVSPPSRSVASISLREHRFHGLLSCQPNRHIQISCLNKMFKCLSLLSASWNLCLLYYFAVICESRIF